MLEQRNPYGFHYSYKYVHYILAIFEVCNSSKVSLRKKDDNVLLQE